MITGKHVLGFSISGAGVLGLVVGGAEWATTHVTTTGSQICASGVPAGPVQIVSGLLTVGGMIVLALAPSLDHQTNKDAVAAVEPSALVKPS